MARPEHVGDAHPRTRCRTAPRRLSGALATNLCSIALAFLSLAGTGSARAAEIPGTGIQVDLVAREQPVAEFVGALFREIGVPVLVSDEVVGVVNGRFEGTAQSVLGELAKAFDMVLYHDGAVTYAYRSNELDRKVLALDRTGSRRAGRMVRDMGLPGAVDQLVEEDSGLVVTGTPRFIAQVEEVVESVRQAPTSTASVPAPPAEPIAQDALAYRVFRLKHAWADDTSFRVAGRDVIVPGVATIVGNLITDAPLIYDAVRRTSVPLGNTVEGLRGTGLASVGGVPAIDEPRGFVIEESVPTGVDAVEAGTMRIVADSRLNAVIVRDTPARMRAYESLIDSLDVESTMVEIEATIIDINTGKVRDLGIDWRADIDDGTVLFDGGALGGSQSSSGSSVVGSPARGGVLSLALGQPADFLARIRLLETRGAARVVSKPHVITLSDVEAVLGSTTEFFVKVAGLEQVDLFNVPVGTLLRVTPHVFKDGTRDRIKLLVNIEDGSQSTERVDSVPVIARTNISTQAVIDDGDSLLVGGLVRDIYEKSDSRVPILGSIPVLGRLFRSDREEARRVERLFMITPRLAVGRGFGPGGDLPRLEGRANDILADSGRRLDAVRWPEREAPEYWPDERPGAAPRARETDGADAVAAVADIDPDRFVSPFTVEKWSTGQ